MRQFKHKVRNLDSRVATILNSWSKRLKGGGIVFIFSSYLVVFHQATNNGMKNLVIVFKFVTGASFLSLVAIACLVYHHNKSNWKSVPSVIPEFPALTRKHWLGYSKASNHRNQRIWMDLTFCHIYLPCLVFHTHTFQPVTNNAVQHQRLDVACGPHRGSQDTQIFPKSNNLYNVFRKYSPTWVSALGIIAFCWKEN